MRETGESGASPPRPRHPAGTARGGRFAAHRQDEQTDTLDGQEESQDTGLEQDVLAASAPGTGPDGLARLLDRGMPLPVRLAAVLSRSCPELTARTAAADPEPAIRALAMLNPHLDEITRARLAGDPDVLAAAGSITGDDPVPAAGPGRPGPAGR